MATRQPLSVRIPFEETRPSGHSETSPRRRPSCAWYPWRSSSGLGAGISLALLDMIGFFTNLFYYQRLSVHLVSPNANTLGAIAIVIPIGGGLIVGLMARFGSEQIRGHGIPEAMERILINGSRVQPRLAVLKPISSAISIGTGGPFGAEGPIILTGGAVGSIVGQLFHLTAAQRRSPARRRGGGRDERRVRDPRRRHPVRGRAVGLRVQPRSMVLIGLAAATADGLRMVMASAGLVSPQPIFPVPDHPPLGGVVLLGAAAVGVATGSAAWLMTQAVYRFEDLFKRLTGHLHWMWWPMIGGVLIGIGGLIDPAHLASGTTRSTPSCSASWRGRSCLAVRRQARHLVGRPRRRNERRHPRPHPDDGGRPRRRPRPRPARGLAGSVGTHRDGRGPGGVTRSPFTAIIFAFELTHDQNSLLASRRRHGGSPGQRAGAETVDPHREGRPARLPRHARYAVDPLEATFVREVMDTDVYTVEPTRPWPSSTRPCPKARQSAANGSTPCSTMPAGLVGVLPWSAVLAAQDEPDTQDATR